MLKLPVRYCFMCVVTRFERDALGLKEICFSARFLLTLLKLALELVTQINGGID